MGNAADLSKTLAALGAKVRDKVAPRAVEEGAKAFAAEVKNAPVLSGKTRASVEVEPARRHGNIISARVTVSGGHQDDAGADRSGGNVIGFEEFGRHGQAPNPFIRRSFASKKDAVVEEIAGEIEAIGS